MDHQWHYDYARLAWDAGFMFGNYHPSNLDKNKLSMLDVDRIIKERDITTVEQYIPLLMHYVLEDDQAEILDSNFVKIFRISQLAIEYLLFCKKYLDNTVILLKKEASRLKQQQKQYNEDPEMQILTPSREYLTAVYKCDKCHKAFSTDSYLNSHIKRRHTDGNITNNNEDNLQSEIKDLKERLNSTDKLLQQINVSEPSVEKNIEKTPLVELEKKFFSFKEQVENEMSTLHLEKNMYEDKYNKLFDLMLQSKQKSNVVLENVGTMTSYNYVIGATKGNECSIHVSTQTEQLKPIDLKQDTVQIISLNDSQENSQGLKKTSHDNCGLEEQRITMIEDIDNKISRSMDTIKDQMNIFWEEMRIQTRNQENSEKEETRTFLNEQNPVQSEITDEIQKPQVKPRTKLLSSSIAQKRQPLPVVTSVEAKQEVSTNDFCENESGPLLLRDLEETKRDYLSKQSHNILEIKAPKYFQDNSSLSERESIEEFINGSEMKNPQKNKNSEKRSNSYSQVSVIDMVMEILQERFPGSQSPLFLVSRNNFHKAMEVLSNHPEINKREEKKIEKKAYKKCRHMETSQTKTNLVKIRLKKSSRQKDREAYKESPASRLAIKNKAIYETDSETEVISPRKNQMELIDDQMSVNSVHIRNENPEFNNFSKEVESPTSTNIRKKVLFETYHSSDEHDESYLEDLFRVSGVQNNRYTQ